MFSRSANRSLNRHTRVVAFNQVALGVPTGPEGVAVFDVVHVPFPSPAFAAWVGWRAVERQGVHNDNAPFRVSQLNRFIAIR